MSWHYLSGSQMPGCSGESPCEQVLSSRWSTIGGIVPISGLAIGVYLAMLMACLFIGSSTEPEIKNLAWSAMLILAGAIATSAVWFTIVQKWLIGEFCPYCMSTHITGLLLSAIVVWQSGRQVKVGLFKLARVISRILTGVLIAVILIVSQIVLTPWAAFSSGKLKNDLTVFNYSDVPVLGSPNAPYVVALLFDYQCSHCQKLHFALNEMIGRYHGKLAFVLCPTPLNSGCNPYIPKDANAFKNSCELAKIALAVWLVKREAYPIFENWMFSFESGSDWHPRSIENASSKAIELVGRENYNAALSKPWIEQYLKTCISLFGHTLESGKGGVPKLIYGSRWIIPETTKIDELIDILQVNLSIPKP
jgi:uncharacterized membrane protein